MIILVIKTLLVLFLHSEAVFGGHTNNVRRLQTNPSLVYIGEDKGLRAYGPCEGDCDDSSDCKFGLNCFQRSGIEQVPGCAGNGNSGRDYCYVVTDLSELVMMGEDSVAGSTFPLRKCAGDCDYDYDCQNDLVCFQRDGTQSVPGCTGNGISGRDYCISRPGPYHLSYKWAKDDRTNRIETLGICQGHCVTSADCNAGLSCIVNNGSLTNVPNCTGKVETGINYCYQAPAPPTTMAPTMAPTAGPTGAPTNAPSRVPTPPSVAPTAGPTGAPTNAPTRAPSPPSVSPPSRAPTRAPTARPTTKAPTGRPTRAPTGRPTRAPTRAPTARPTTKAPTRRPTGAPTIAPTGAPTNENERRITYRPGDLVYNETKAGLVLSRGLTARVIAETGKQVSLYPNGLSAQAFHSAPDGAAVFADKDTGGWIYVSNSESSSSGGVGAITFDKDGNVKGYKRILGNTRRNCGGGKTYWNTWLTCEEIDGGQVFEADPWGNSAPKSSTALGQGMNYESAAYDYRDPTKPTFYVTVDESNGPLVRFTPSRNTVANCVADASTGKYRKEDCSPMLYDSSGTHHYLKITKITQVTSKLHVGEYTWTTSLTEGRKSAELYHNNGEGIDIRDGKIYYTAKLNKHLFIINLDPDPTTGKLTFERSSTSTGAFEGHPDQVARVLNFDTGETDGILYFCEDGGPDNGIYGRDSNGKFFTILTDNRRFGTETTGLAFSPDGMFMYLSYQGVGKIFEVKRTDGFPFQGTKLDILIHSNSPEFIIRNLQADNAKTCELVSEMCVSDP